jgi:hypothetical protein
MEIIIKNDGPIQIRKKSQGFLCPCGNDGATYGYNGWAYEDKRLNYSLCCPDCWKELHEYVSERWSEYHGSVL